MFPDSGANSGLSEKDLPSLLGFDAAYLSGYSLFNPLSTQGVMRIISEIKKVGIPLIFDPASVGTMMAFGREQVINTLAHMNIAIMNEDEARYISNCHSLDEALAFLTSIISTVVIKTGSSGAIAQIHGGSSVTANTDAIAAIDTTGAGDAFAAGFIPNWLTTKDLFAAMNAGNEIARRCVSIIGARPSVNPQ
jgi:sugar/nucleoside kinase (ribokinase family)